MYYVYILRTTSNTFYIGYTNNIKRRILEHKGHTERAAKYIKAFTDCKLVYFETYRTRMQATIREWWLKRQSHGYKNSLVELETGLLKDE